MRGDDHLPDDVLLLLVDGELPAARRAAVRSHLQVCAACAARRDRFLDLGRRFTVEGEPPWRREALRARLASEGPGVAAWSRAIAGLSSGALAAAALVVAIGVTAAIAERARAPRRLDAAIEPGARPLPAVTPGATTSADVRELCSSGGSALPHEVPAAVRSDVLRAYRMEDVPADQYELDYLITPELGGAAEARNLWPQRYTARVWNASVKDQLEDLLPRLVCEGRIDLKTAQRDIAIDWIAAYRKYFHASAPIGPSTTMAGQRAAQSASLD